MRILARVRGFVSWACPVGVVSDRTRFSLPIMSFAARSARLTASPARTYSSSTRTDCKVLVVGAGEPFTLDVNSLVTQVVCIQVPLASPSQISYTNVSQTRDEG